MANHASAEKRARHNRKRSLINKGRTSRIRTSLKKVEQALAVGDSTAAEIALRAAQPDLYRGAGKGVVSKKTTARKMSRLAARIKNLKKPSKASGTR